MSQSNKHPDDEFVKLYMRANATGRLLLQLKLSKMPRARMLEIVMKVRGPVTLILLFATNTVLLVIGTRLMADFVVFLVANGLILLLEALVLRYAQHIYPTTDKLLSEYRARHGCLPPSE